MEFSASSAFDLWASSFSHSLHKSILARQKRNYSAVSFKKIRTFHFFLTVKQVKSTGEFDEKYLRF